MCPPTLTLTHTYMCALAHAHAHANMHPHTHTRTHTQHRINWRTQQEDRIARVVLRMGPVCNTLLLNFVIFVTIWIHLSSTLSNTLLSIPSRGMFAARPCYFYFFFCLPSITMYSIGISHLEKLFFFFLNYHLCL